jgi:hypothetical protein
MQYAEISGWRLAMMRSTVSVKANLRQMLMPCSCGQLFNRA